MIIPGAVDGRMEEIKEELGRIAQANGGLLNPRQVVEAARDPDNCLHQEFDWEDATAAESYRLVQAASLIRRVKLIVVRQEAQSRKLSLGLTRAWMSRPSQRHAEGGYTSVDDVLRDPDMRVEMLARILSDLMVYRNRYAAFLELSKVWAAIDNARISVMTESLSRDEAASA